MFSKILIANRGEIAIRIARAIADCGASSLAIYSEDDATSLHVRRADEACAIPGSGAGAYLHIENIVEAARKTGSDAIHPGYGFLSESADFATACRAAGIAFIGPSSKALALFGDKSASRQLAMDCNVPVLDGTNGPTSVTEAEVFFKRLPASSAAIIKAVAGGGGRGMRIVRALSDVASMHEVCQREAQQAFGKGDVYIEALMEGARHVEIQILGDSAGNLVHFGERECTLQRRGQKLIEFSPSPSLAPAVRQKLIDYALAMAARAGYCGLGTFEFLVGPVSVAFIECNPRLQVEHTVTEEVTGIDLVRSQIGVAAGRSLRDLGIAQAPFPPPNKHAVQLRINMETLLADGTIKPAAGTIESFEPPFGPGIRIETYAYGGYKTSTRFDSLLAKVCVSAANYTSLLKTAYLSLSHFRIAGVQTNIGFLQTLLAHPDVAQDRIDTGFVDRNLAALVSAQSHRQRYFEPSKSHADRAERHETSAPAGTSSIAAPLQGQLVALHAKQGERVEAGQVVAVLEAMKMENTIRSRLSGVIHSRCVDIGDIVSEGQTLFYIEADHEQPEFVATDEAIDPDHVPDGVLRLFDERAQRLDDKRTDAVAKRTSRGLRTPRTNIDHLCDAGSFLEFGSFLGAIDGNAKIPPGDGAITGLATVNADIHGPRKSECAVVAFDTTVLAGTMGTAGRQKMERMFRLAEQQQLPLVLFAEGGGARSGEEAGTRSLKTFCTFVTLNGKIPTIGIVNGPCFAANAALLGCCDVIIGTTQSSIGMAGPAMIEGGGLGVVRPEDVGPASVQSRNGVIDVLVDDEAEAVEVARKYLGFFQGPLATTGHADQRLLRNIIPENRKQSYEMRALINTLVDTGSFLELRAGFGKALITGFARIDGVTLGIVASNPQHLGGAIDTDASDKAARFMQLCEAFQHPILTLIDTPGFMVGPEAEKEALVRHTSRLMVIASHMSVPYVSIIVRKCYGLGGLGMNGGDHQRPLLLAAWPTAEHGSMNVEGSVRLALKGQMADMAPDQQQTLFDEQVTKLYDRGSAFSTARRGAVDELIDPAESRTFISRALHSEARRERQPRRLRMIDTW